MSEPFANRYGPMALITGASSGIGWGFAEELAERGLNLVLVARRLERLEELASLLDSRFGTQCTLISADLSQLDAPEKILEATCDLDIGLLVSNAGYGFKGEHSQNDPVGMSEMLMVNCNMPLRLTHGFLPRLRARGHGGIILTSSVEAMIGVPYSAAYSASKAFVSTLGEALWAETANDDIDMLTLCPGATETEALARHGINPSQLQDLKAPREVAQLALDAITQGPTFISSAHYEAQFGKLLSMPRRDALLAMAGAGAQVAKAS